MTLQKKIFPTCMGLWVGENCCVGETETETLL